MGGKTFDYTYASPIDAVFTATVRAVGELGYAVTFASAEAGVVTFNTGRSGRTWAGQDLTATLIPGGDGTRVIIGGSLATRGSPWGGGSQLAGWGEKADLANLVLDTVAEMLAESEEVPLDGLSDDELEGLSDEDAAQLADIKRQFEQGRLTATDYQAMRNYLGVPPDR